MTTATLQHKFEIAGLGVYPFQCTGMVTRVITYPTGESQPSGTCDYCGNGIKYCCVIRDANGKTFEVGTDCVMKTGDRGLVDALKCAQREKKANERRAKWEAEYNSPERVAERERYAAEGGHRREYARSYLADLRREPQSSRRDYTINVSGDDCREALALTKRAERQRLQRRQMLIGDADFGGRVDECAHGDSSPCSLCGASSVGDPTGGGGHTLAKATSTDFHLNCSLIKKAD